MAKKDYISRAGFDRLTGELDGLLRVERPKVVGTVAAAAAEGDRSENAEYIYGKKRLRQIDKRIEFLSKHIDTLEVCEPPRDLTRVRFLSWVKLEDQDGNLRAYRLVGADESSASEGLISWKSPVGRALMGKGVDDEFEVQTPGGVRWYTVLQIGRERPET